VEVPTTLDDDPVLKTQVEEIRAKLENNESAAEDMRRILQECDDGIKAAVGDFEQVTDKQAGPCACAATSVLVITRAVYDSCIIVTMHDNARDHVGRGHDLGGLNALENVQRLTGGVHAHRRRASSRKSTQPSTC
jgi:hypothetical protein